MLLCGFESFDNLSVRIDILERLFIMIFNIDKNSNDIQKEIRLVPEMINLLGCNKDNFKKLLGKMNYKTYLKNNDIYFKYMPYKQNIKKTNNYKNDKNYAVSPFEKLVQLNIK